MAPRPNPLGDVLVDGVIAPWRRGDAIHFRPPGWVAEDRPGAVELQPNPVLIVEGAGAGQSGLAVGAELVVWVQADGAEACRRGIARDVQLSRTPKEAEAFWDEWIRAEEPFLANDQPWTRASLVVNGTPPTVMQAHAFVASGPLNA